MTKVALKSSVARIRAPKPSSERRRRASDNARVRIEHRIEPSFVERAADAVPGEKISEFLLRQGWSKQEKIDGKLRWTWRLPTICVVNGQPLLQRQWKRRRIAANDNIEFISRPLGGNRGKAIAGIVGTIALATFAPWASGALLSAGFSPLFAYGSVAAICVGGSLLIIGSRQWREKN
jgi:hypothetical protein